MDSNVLMDKIAEHGIALGYANSFPDAGAVEYGCRGWDFVWMCSQHGYYDYAGTYHCMLAAERHGVATVVRVPGHEPGYFSRILDLAPSAVMVPLVNTAQQAAQLAAAATYPPQGTRSYLGLRALTLYGGAYHTQKHTLVIAQIETEEAVENAQAIIDTPGIDMLFFSESDMKVGMGLPLETCVDENPVLTGYFRKVAQACRNAGKLCGAVAVTDAILKMAAEEGYSAAVAAGDSFFLSRSLPYAAEVRQKANRFLNKKGG